MEANYKLLVTNYKSANYMSGWNKKLEGLQLNTEESLHSLEFATSQEAWEKLNEGFLRLDPILFGKGAMANSGVAVVYNVFIKIRKAWVDPEFDYGRCFNYKETKWTILLNNYIDFNKLDLLRSKLRVLRNKYNQNYNITYMFNNHHDNGKQCLIAATFSKRFGEDIPVITMVVRASEITKRLIFDFLLIQRMSEYVYGPDQSVQINLFATQMYGNVETLLMYHTHKPLKKVLKGAEENSWNKRIKEVRAVVILREYLVKFAVFHHIVEISVLCDVPAARAVDIDLRKSAKSGERSLTSETSPRIFSSTACLLRARLSLPPSMKKL